MSEGEGKEQADAEAASESGSQLSKAVRDVGASLLPILLTAGGFVGFVAVAGGAIVWTRLWAAQLPADQAVAALPQGELVAIGAVSLSLFGVLGAIAAVGIYLIDRGGRPTPGMSRGLLWLVLLEGLVVIFLVEGDMQRRLVAAEVLAVLAVVALIVTRVPAFVAWEDDLPARGKEGPDLESGSPTLFDGSERDTKRIVLAPLVTVAVGVLAVAVNGVFTIGDNWTLWIVLGGIFLVVPLIVLGVLWVLSDQDGQSKQDAGGELGDDEVKFKPPRLQLKRTGEALMAVLALLAVAVPALILWEWWPVAALGVSMVLGFALWRIANLNGDRFLWYGVAVFFSVPLFGAVVGIAMNLDDPQVQPMALIRATDGPDEAIQGLYVTETDDRVYFATLATEGCGKRIASRSGRLLWVPRSDVVAMSLGPLQDVDDAGTKALEMFYALTPSAAAPAGKDDLSLTLAEAGAERGAAAEPPKRDRRLENVGPAVRRDFGSGIVLDPPSAPPGELVTLKMSHPNPRSNGFGQRQQGRAVRVGGVVAAVRSWQPRAITFVVPHVAFSGPVTLECSQLAGQPLLRVTRAPKARISIRTLPGDEVVFDSGGSRDDEQIVSRRWIIEGRRQTRAKKVSAVFRPGQSIYSVQLRVVDSDGQVGTAQVELLRLAEKEAELDAGEAVEAAFERLQGSLSKEQVNKLPQAIELHGMAVGDGKSIERSGIPEVREALLESGAAETEEKDKPASARSIPVKSFGLSEGCPLEDPDLPPRVRRVDLFVLDRGVTIDLPGTCQYRRVAARKLWLTKRGERRP